MKIHSATPAFVIALIALTVFNLLKLPVYRTNTVTMTRTNNFSQYICTPINDYYLEVPRHSVDTEGLNGAEKEIDV